MNVQVRVSIYIFKNLKFLPSLAFRINVLDLTILPTTITNPTAKTLEWNLISQPALTLHTTIEVPFVKNIVDFNSFMWEFGESFNALPNMQSKCYSRVKLAAASPWFLVQSGRKYTRKSICIQAELIKIIGNDVIFHYYLHTKFILHGSIIIEIFICVVIIFHIWIKKFFSTADYIANQVLVISGKTDWK